MHEFRRYVHSFDLCTYMNSFSSIRCKADMMKLRLLKNRQFPCFIVHFWSKGGNFDIEIMDFDSKFLSSTGARFKNDSKITIFVVALTRFILTGFFNGDTLW